MDDYLDPAFEINKSHNKSCVSHARYIHHDVIRTVLSPDSELPLTQCANILQNITKTYPQIFMVIFLKVDTLFNIWFW